MSKIIDQQLEKTLIALGLNNKEIQVYIELLSGGEMSAIAVSKNTVLHRQFVYNALLSLREKGLVERIGEARCKWRAENPRKFIYLAEQKEKQATEASDMLLNLMQKKVGQEFEVMEGNKAFRSRIIKIMRSLPAKSTFLMICGEWEKYFEQAGEFVHKEWDRLRISKEINFRLIGPESLNKSMKDSALKRGYMDYRVMSGLEKNLVNINIYGETVDFEIYGEPHLTFSIKNPDVAESQRIFFEALWIANSKKV